MKDATMKENIFRLSVFGLQQLPNLRHVLICLVGMVALTAQAVVTNTPAEYSTNHAWVVQNILTATNPPPFSFNYNGVDSSGSNLFSGWSRLITVTNCPDTNRTQYTLQWTNASDGL